MTTYQFMLRLAQPPVDEQVRRLFQRASDLCLEVGAWRGWAAAAVDRDAPSLADAIVTAVRDLEAVGLVPVDCGADHDLAPVWLIAERAGCSQSAVRRWAGGQSGPPGFPQPAGPGDRQLYYRWPEVADWLAERLGLRLADHQPTCTAANLVLRLRALAPTVDTPEALWSLL